MNKPVKPEALLVLPPRLTGRLQAHVESGQFESVPETVFVAASASADQLEFDTRDDAGAIRRSIEASVAARPTGWSNDATQTSAFALFTRVNP